ncbi:hypothetical protein PanWU01x14_128110, partial [Parasponia andersonii]
HIKCCTLPLSRSASQFRRTLIINTQRTMLYLRDRDSFPCATRQVTILIEDICYNRLNLLHGNLVRWKKYKQNMVAISSMDKRHRSMTFVASELLCCKLLTKMALGILGTRL